MIYYMVILVIIMIMIMNKVCAVRSIEASLLLLLERISKYTTALGNNDHSCDYHGINLIDNDF